jgi:hypothetical protein
MKGNFVMATVEYKSGDYEIGASATQEFTFWWGTDYHEGGEYFDVSIAPTFSPGVPTLPIVEVQRAHYLDTSEGSARSVLLLTLRNDNKFPVYFIANHVRIY